DAVVGRVGDGGSAAPAERHPPAGYGSLEPAAVEDGAVRQPHLQHRSALEQHPGDEGVRPAPHRSLASVSRLRAPEAEPHADAVLAIAAGGPGATRTPGPRQADRAIRVGLADRYDAAAARPYPRAGRKAGGRAGRGRRAVSL